MELRMNMRKLLVLLVALTLLVGCESSKPVETEKPKPKPVELLTGRFAFYKMLVPAHGWARDAQPFSMDSVVNSDSTGKDGKAAIWRAGFASPAGRGLKPYTWSGSDAQDAPARGISFGTEDNYNPNNSSTQVFDPAFLKIDTDQAFETAQKHGGEKLLAAAPDTPITYRLGWDRNAGKLIWRVIYGNEGKLSVEVDATTGGFLRIEK
jgi:hypothetical protein